MLMLVSGLVMGFLTGALEALEHLTGSGRFMRIFTDMLLSIVITIVLFLAMLFSTRLDFRLYSVAAAGLGAAIYRLTIHPALKMMVNFVRKRLKCLCNSYNLKKIFQFLCK